MKTNILKSLALAVVMLVLFQSSYAASDAKKPAKKAEGEKKIKSPKIDLRNVKVKNVEFGFNKASVSAESYSRLDNAVKVMANNNAAIKLSGHADSKGGYVYNWKLSQARANAVKDYMVSKGADSSRIAATEFGDTKPIASNKTKTGRQKNRRVEISFAQ